MKRLRISERLTLPLDFVTSTAAVIAMRRVGKTYLASVLAEELSKAGQRIVVIDPTDAWWGLRASADGKREGLPITVLGGPNGDLPLHDAMGAEIADLVVEERMSVVLSLRHLSQAGLRLFVADFGERLYLRKGEPRHHFPLHCFFDECDAYIPQKLVAQVPNALRAFSAIDVLIRRGGSSGIGGTIITQRPAVVNKDVLSQTDTLFALRTVSPYDRKAIKEWVAAHDIAGEGGELLSSLASLPKGDAWVWSPGTFDLFERVTVRERDTFNSSRTPKVGERVKPPKRLAKIDLERVKGRLAAVVERVEADKPSTLKRRIAELERELRERRPTKTPPAPREYPTIDVDAARRWLNGKFAAMVKGIADKMDKEAERLFDEALGKVKGARVVFLPTVQAGKSDATDVAVVAKQQARATPPVVKKTRDAEVVDGALTGPERKILAAVAWLQTIVGNTMPDIATVAFVAGYPVTSGAFKNPRSSLRTKGLIVYPSPGTMALSESGNAVADFPVMPHTNKDVQDAVRKALDGPMCKLFDVCIRAWPDAVTIDALAQATGYPVTSGAFKNPRSRLRTLGVVDYPSPGQIRAADCLFPEDRR